MTSTAPTHKIKNVKTGTVHAGWLYEDSNAVNHLACGANGVYGPARGGFKSVTLSTEITCKKCAKAVAAFTPPPAEEPTPEPATEVPTFQIVVWYRVTKAPFNGRDYKTPMVVTSTLLGDVSLQIAGLLGLPWYDLEMTRIEVMDDPAEEAPLDGSTVTIAPGIYYRPITTSSGRSTSYTLHWARLIDQGLVYDITQDDGFTHDKHRVQLRSGTFAEVQTWLRHKGFKL